MSSPASLIDMLARTAKLDITQADVEASGVISYDDSAAAYTDHTAESSSNAIFTPFSSKGDTDDLLYIGSTAAFDAFEIEVETAGDGTDVAGGHSWEYYDGSAWQALTVTDETTGLTVSGIGHVRFSEPDDWGTIDINSQGAFYYVRMHLSANNVYQTTSPVLKKIILGDNSRERVLALEWLQEAADLLVADLDLLVPAQATVTLTAGQSEYALDASPFPTDMLRVLSVYLSDTTVTSYPMTQLTLDQIDSRHTGSQANSTPFEYGVDWPRFRMYPAPQANSTILLRYAQDGAATLTDTYTEITWIPQHLQKGCLFTLAMARAQEFKKNYIAADRWEAKFYNDRTQGLPAARRWKASGGGRQGPQMGAGAPVATVPSQDIGGLH